MASRQPPLLPKKGSGAFKEELARVLSTLDLPRLCVVLEGALDRRKLEELLRKGLKGKAVKPGAIDRAQLVAAVAELFSLRSEIAFGAMRALDKSCQKERFIVASMDEDGMEVRLKAYRAIDFRRERARLLWALIRDGRQEPAKVARAVLDEHFELVARGVQEQEETHPLIGDEPDDNSFVRSLKKRVATYEEAIEEQAEVIHREKSEREGVEDERSQLVVKLGQHQLALKAEEKRRKAADEEVRQLRGEVTALRDQLERLDPARLRDTEQERDQLRERARSLQRRVEHAEELTALQDENDALRSELDEVKADRARQKTENQQLLRQLASREQAAQRRADSLRESLKTARKLATAPKPNDSLVDGNPEVERVGIFVDAANLSASARREGAAKFDFMAMLRELVGQRQVAAAVAFIVDAEEPSEGFAAFRRALEQAGYDVRVKRPKIRSDGSRKADWDMGIAMEILDRRHRLDTVVLCSGDGDYLPLLRKLKGWGKRVEVASHRASTDRDLLRIVDEHVDLTGRFAAS